MRDSRRPRLNPWEVMLPSADEQPGVPAGSSAERHLRKPKMQTAGRKLPKPTII